MAAICLSRQAAGQVHEADAPRAGLEAAIAIDQAARFHAQCLGGMRAGLLDDATDQHLAGTASPIEGA